MSTNIEEAIAAAKAAAGNIPQEINANMMTTMGGGTAVGTPAQRGAPIGLDDLLQGSLNVVNWLKVNELGIRIGNDNTLFEELDVVIPMYEIVYKYSIRYGNPAIYESTYDRVTSNKGGSWMEALMRAQRVDPNAREFRSADIPFYSVNRLTNKKGEVLVEVGQALGHSLAVTGWQSFASFIQKLKSDGLDCNRGLIQIKLGFSERKNQKGTWGVLEFHDPKQIDAFPWEPVN